MSFAWTSGNGTQDFLGIGVFLTGYFPIDFLAARNSSVWSDYIGDLLGVGFMVAGYGTNMGHELTHRTKNWVSMMEGRWLLSASCNADFAIGHVYGHHVTVGTHPVHWPEVYLQPICKKIPALLLKPKDCLRA